MTTPARILVVEDEQDIADVLLDYLRHAGYAPEHAADGHTALQALTAPQPPDLTLLDVMLPGIDGLEVLRQARRHTDNPIVVITARVEEVDRLIGLELGADDYICKPFSPREVVARVKAVLRRRAPLAQAAAQAELAYGALVLDEAQLQATLHGALVALTPREWHLLRTLLAHPRSVLSRAQLLQHAYPDSPQEPNERAVDSHIKNLRRKLRSADPAGHDWIRSVYGVGFAFDPPAAPQDAQD